MDSRAWIRVVNVLAWVWRRGRSRFEVILWRVVKRDAGREGAAAGTTAADVVLEVVCGCGGGVSEREADKAATVCGRVGIARWR